MKRKCPHCIGTEFRRVNRVGFFERRILTLLGFYPWECVLCRRKTYLMTDGHDSRHGGQRTRPNE